MSVFRLTAGLAALLFCFTFSGWDTGGSAPETMTDQSELERFLAENPDVDNADTGEEEIEEE